MRYLMIILTMTMILLGCFCSSEQEKPALDLGLNDTGEAFNPQKWHGITRRDLAKILPSISNIAKDFSGGPFVLQDTMDLKSINFTFEHSERDARLINLYVDFPAPVTVTAAAQKFGINLTGIQAQKAKRNWIYALNKPLVHAFFVKLKPTDTDTTRLSNAWISYRLN